MFCERSPPLSRRSKSTGKSFPWRRTKLRRRSACSSLLGRALTSRTECKQICGRLQPFGINLVGDCDGSQRRGAGDRARIKAGSWMLAAGYENTNHARSKSVEKQVFHTVSFFAHKNLLPLLTTRV